MTTMLWGVSSNQEMVTKPIMLAYGHHDVQQAILESTMGSTNKGPSSTRHIKCTIQPNGKPNEGPIPHSANLINQKLPVVSPWCHEHFILYQSPMLDTLTSSYWETMPSTVAILYLVSMNTLSREV
jgi:hypothetical protein